MVKIIDRVVPTVVMPIDTSIARVTTSPPRIDLYASREKAVGKNPPDAAASREAKLIAMT